MVQFLVWLRALLVAASLVGTTGSVLAAGAEETGSEPVLLTLILPDGTERHLDRAALEAMPQDGFTTTTIWTEGPQEFRGVHVSNLFAAVGIEASEMTLMAVNGYEVVVAMDQLHPDDALIAYERNGAMMTLRDKGPLWLVYDFDADPLFRTEVAYSHAIWQLDRIAIRN